MLQTALVQPFPGQAVAVPPPDMGPVAFDLVKGDDHKPSSTEGATIYLSAMVGFICFFLDSEGNRIGIQQPAANKR